MELLEQMSSAGSVCVNFRTFVVIEASVQFSYEMDEPAEGLRHLACTRAAPGLVASFLSMNCLLPAYARLVLDKLEPQMPQLQAANPNMRQGSDCQHRKSGVWLNVCHRQNVWGHIQPLSILEVI